MNIEQARCSVESLFQKTGVSAVFYIDDYLSFDGLKLVSSFIEENSIDNISKTIPSIDDKILAAKRANVPDISKFICDWWALCDVKQQESILQKFNSQINLSENTLKQIFGEKCIFCSPDQWESSVSEQCLHYISSGKIVLILFDNKIISNYFKKKRN